MDFAGSPEQAARTINAWVAEATGGRIPIIVHESRISASTPAMIAKLQAAGDGEHFVSARDAAGVQQRVRKPRVVAVEFCLGGAVGIHLKENARHKVGNVGVFPT